MHQHAAKCIVQVEGISKSRSKDDIKDQGNLRIGELRKVHPKKFKDWRIKKSTSGIMQQNFQSDPTKTVGDTFCKNANHGAKAHTYKTSHTHPCTTLYTNMAMAIALGNQRHQG